MSSHNKRVMSLEDKVRIIRKFETLTNPSDINNFIKSNAYILRNKSKILHQYDNMKVKLAAVRDHVTKQSYVEQKQDFLRKIIVEWYRRAFQKHINVSVALLDHSTDVAGQLLNIAGMPLSESQISDLKKDCQQARFQESSNFDESATRTLCIRKIAQEILKEMGISKATALNMYGPRIFQEVEDKNEDGLDILWNSCVGNRIEKRKLTPTERSSNKSMRTSSEKHVSNRGDSVEIVSDEEDADATHSNDCLWPFEVAVEEDNKNEEEDIELYDVVSVVDSTEEVDADTSGAIGSTKETEVPRTVLRTEPGEGQPTEGFSTDAIKITDVRERVKEWLIEKACEITEDEGNGQETCATLDPICSIKIESEGLTEQTVNCERISTTTCLEDCVSKGTEEANSDRDDDRLVHLYTVCSEDKFNDSATSSTESPRCVYSDQDAVRTLNILKGYLQRQKNRRALEALAKVEAAFPRSSEK